MALAMIPAPTVAPQNPAAVYLSSLGLGSRRAQACALETLARIASSGRCGAEDLPWHELRYQHTQAIRAHLADRFAPATANRHLAALRGALREAWRLGLLGVEAYQRAADLEPIRGQRIPSGRALEVGEIRRLFGACEGDASPAGARDAALFALLYGAGLRRAEAAALEVADYDPATGGLRIDGKGSKERMAYVDGGARRAIERWLLVRGGAPGALLCPVDRCGRLEIRGISEQAIFAACRRRADEAGIEAFSPHDLRRSFVSDLLDAGADLPSVQKLAGHANPATTLRYDRRGERAKQRAIGLLSVPFGGAA